NLSMLVANVTFDECLPDSPLKDWIFKFCIYGSHCFSLSHTIGKILLIATRFYAICYPFKGDVSFIWNKI
ncbi:hypothetical protein PMAYCL1PPCAC_13428, partial [Pristionchus mayeri]